MLISVTDHAVERYLQRVRGVLDPRPEIAGRVRRAWEAERVSDGERGALLDELVVVTLWEDGDDPAVPKRFTDALRRRR